MNDLSPTKARDYSQTLFLPKTDFPMRAGLPQKEPEFLARWQKIDLYGAAACVGQGQAALRVARRAALCQRQHPYRPCAQQILKDVVTRSQQMLGHDSNYVPGWDCHGLPIEWKIEEENYRAKGKPKPDFSNPAALVAFRRECRAFAAALDRGAARRIHPARRHRRLGAPLHHHGAVCGGTNSARTDEVRHQRHALPRLKAGDVVGGGEDRAGRGRGRVRGLRQ